MRHHHHHHHHHDHAPELHFRLEGPDDDALDGRGRRGRRGGPGGHGGMHGGPHGHGGPGWGGHRRGPRARGDVRAAVLLLLEEQPRHGYELIQEIAERSGGAWTPSPGSIYPTLLVLEDEGLLTVEQVEGRKTASLTPDGLAYVEEHRERLGTPWESTDARGPALDLRREILALKDAVAQVARVGTPGQHTAAVAVLTAARKDLYRLLAEDSPAEE